uniref:Uncharacterized protein n=1 Tax=Sphaerodactylus townsendi TaxID=933632 RepID=A0ACB8EZ36_9SAUR
MPIMNMVLYELKRCPASHVSLAALVILNFMFLQKYLIGAPSEWLVCLLVRESFHDGKSKQILGGIKETYLAMRCNPPRIPVQALLKWAGNVHFPCSALDNSHPFELGLMEP